MSYVISLHSGFARLIEQARGWFRRSLRPRTGGSDNTQDDLYEIFLLGPTADARQRVQLFITLRFMT